jgi:hypothetical protein
MHQVETSRRSAPVWIRSWPVLPALVTIASACDSTTVPPATAPVPVAIVSVSPGSLGLTVGSSLPLDVTLADPAGNVLADRPSSSSLLTPSSDGEAVSVIGDSRGRTGRIVTWASDRPAVATVDVRGVVTALRPGKATVTATSEGRTGAVQVLVSEAVDGQLAVTPTSASLSVQESLDFDALLRTDGGSAPGTTIWSVNPESRATVDADGRVTALSAGPVTVTAIRGEHRASTELVIAPNSVIRGLDFPGNAGVETTIRFEFTRPLPAFPATYVWRAYPRQQQSYYTTFFWGNNGPFYNSNTYYGFHPYPDWNTDYQHFWEIATPPGSDVVSSRHVVYDRWYTQVALCQVEKDAIILEFYWDWPDSSKVIRHRGSRVTDPPEPVLVIGDAPWNAGNEVWNGILRGFQFYDGALTSDEIAREIAAPGSVRSPWYLNLNPTPKNIADESGNGHDPAWVGSERPASWTGIITSDGIILRDVGPR